MLDRLERMLGKPVDQTLSAAVAQIQVVAQKRFSESRTADHPGERHQLQFTLQRSPNNTEIAANGLTRRPKWDEYVSHYPPQDER